MLVSMSASLMPIFQFSPLREGRRGHAQVRHHEPDFNSRPCERGDGERCGGTMARLKFQFSPLREGRLDLEVLHIVVLRDFNSRPCERGDQVAGEQLQRNLQFQFSPLREGRRSRFRFALSSFAISILAPARGATALRVHRARGVDDFNSRPCERGDQDQVQGRLRFSHFNSRPCERGDIVGLQKMQQLKISILAPARGATPS